MSLLSLQVVETKASGINKSEFLAGCFPSCEVDAKRLGHGSAEGKRRCDCYCQRMLILLDPKDLDYFKKHQDYSTQTKKKVLRAYEQCFLN